MGSLYRPRGSRFWWMRYSVRGQLIRRSTKTTDRRQAERLLALRQAGVAPQPGDPDISHILGGIPHAPYAFFSGHVLKQLRGPLVYVFISTGRVKYVGASAGGLGRALSPSHHVLGSVNVHDGDALLYLPCATREEADRLEHDLIDLLRPEWNDGGAPEQLTQAEHLILQREALRSLDQRRQAATTVQPNGPHL
jgi:hypothetical protein